jgi:DNA-binding Xre family transcriptional regulator
VLVVTVFIESHAAHQKTLSDENGYTRIRALWQQNFPRRNERAFCLPAIVFRVKSSDGTTKRAHPRRRVRRGVDTIAPAMIRHTVRRVAEQQGITTPYGLHKKTDLPYETCRRLWHDRGAWMKKDTLARLCATLRVQPADLIDWVPEDKDLPPEKRRKKKA